MAPCRYGEVLGGPPCNEFSRAKRAEHNHALGMDIANACAASAPPVGASGGQGAPSPRWFDRRWSVQAPPPAVTRAGLVVLRCAAMIPAAIYVRVSKDDGSQTADNQLPDVQQMAVGRGYVVAPEHVYSDEASGAKGADERPALAAMLQAAARGRFKAVFVWRLDRLSRDDTFRGGLQMIGELDRFGVALLSHGETWIDTAGPFRSVLVQISLTLAAEERRVLIDRTKAGIARARVKGTRSGRPIGRAAGRALKTGWGTGLPRWCGLALPGAPPGRRCPARARCRPTGAENATGAFLRSRRSIGPVRKGTPICFLQPPGSRGSDRAAPAVRKRSVLYSPESENGDGGAYHGRDEPVPCWVSVDAERRRGRGTPSGFRR